MPSRHQYYYASKPGAVMNEHQASRGTTWVTALLVDLLEELLSVQYNIYTGSIEPTTLVELGS